MQIRFLDPRYDPDRAQKLISSSMSRYLSTRNMLHGEIKCIYLIQSHARVFGNLAHRQTYRQTDRQTNEQRGKDIPPPLSEVNDGVPEGEKCFRMCSLFRFT